MHGPGLRPPNYCRSTPDHDRSSRKAADLCAASCVDQLTCTASAQRYCRSRAMADALVCKGHPMSPRALSEKAPKAMVTEIATRCLSSLSHPAQMYTRSTAPHLLGAEVCAAEAPCLLHPLTPAVVYRTLISTQRDRGFWKQSTPLKGLERDS